jgi:hypothetical protein
MHIKELREALRRHRLKCGMSYEELATDIAIVVGRKHRMSLWTVQRFIEGITEKPHEMTLYALEQYMAAKGEEAA